MISLNDSAPRRFWKKVDKTGDPNGCWLWLGATYATGYGCFAYDGYRHTPAQRVALMLTGTDVPPRAHVHHLCERRDCVNPDHLEVLSAREHRIVHAKWTRERIVIAIQGFATEFGRLPTIAEWSPAQARASGNRTWLAEQYAERDWPCASSVTRMFGGWANAMREAGFEPRRRGVQAISRASSWSASVIASSCRGCGCRRGR